MVKLATCILGFWLSVSASLYAGAEIPSPVIELGSNLMGLDAMDVSSQVNCIFSRLPYTHKVRDLPWRRAHQDVVRETLDGFFTAVPDVEMDEHAVLSDPLILENWYWFRLREVEPTDTEHRRIGAIRGSHQALWFERQGINTVNANHLSQLIKLLLAGRIDTILVDLEHFEAAALELNLAPERYVADFFSYVPMGVYFSHHFLARHKDFLTLFNSQIYSCSKASFALSPQEQARVHEAVGFLYAWVNEASLLDAVVAQNRRHQSMRFEQIQRLDSFWINAFAKGEDQLMIDMQDAGLTEQLDMWRLQHEIVTEIIVMDEYGLNVAVSPFTSDYWQGDEAKFQQTIQAEPGKWFFDEVQYDHSTRKFQVQISVPLYRSANTQSVGAITIGVDIHQVLSRAQ